MMSSENQDSSTAEKKQAASSGLLPPTVFKALEDVAHFSSTAYVKRPIFDTEALQFGMYFFEPGQINPLHRHPQSSEICYFVEGTGEIVIGQDTAVVKPGDSIHIPENVYHEIRNTGSNRMMVVVMQSPLPCKTERAD
jgi:quercetin dioxygenase-like cupin family protein